MYDGNNPGGNLFADGGLQVFAKRLLAAETKTAKELTVVFAKHWQHLRRCKLDAAGDISRP